MSTDNLMLVSVAGLVVNIFGLLAFHEAHNHGLNGAECALHDHSADDGCCGDDHGGAATMALSPSGELVVRAVHCERALVDSHGRWKGPCLQTALDAITVDALPCYTVR